MTLPESGSLGSLTVGGVLKASTVTTSDDGSMLFIASDSSLLVFSSVTGERIQLLNGHAAEVTAICRDPSDGNKV
jgi:hypothetical protein